jgi:glycosyltransferase involved in cell wall biosynthesis
MRTPAAESSNRQHEKTVVFIGSPDFAPNKFALDWILGKLAPQLEAIDPTITVTLVGKGTQHMEGVHRKNINALGFVPEEHLASLLQSCLCTISPIAHGTGIKIKVLESFAAGCPVFATTESLRGVEFMGISPKIEIDNPKETAEKIAAFANDPNGRETERANIRKVWTNHVARRKGELNRLIAEILGLKPEEKRE